MSTENQLFSEIYTKNQLFSEIYTKNQLFCEFSLLCSTGFGNCVGHSDNTIVLETRTLLESSNVTSQFVRFPRVVCTMY